MGGYCFNSNVCFHLRRILCLCRSNLRLVRELGDTQAQGRTIGNLGNTHYLLGNYKKAIKYHSEVSGREVMCSDGLYIQ